MSKHPLLFVCVENAGRSQMAEAFARKYGLDAESAGTVPSMRINPSVVQVMLERGLDISRNNPKKLTADSIREARLVVTMGCSIEEACPKPIVAQMQKKLLEWHIEDPKGKPLEEVRRIRDEIQQKVADLASVAEPVTD